MRFTLGIGLLLGCAASQHAEAQTVAPQPALASDSRQAETAVPSRPSTGFRIFSEYRIGPDLPGAANSGLFGIDGDRLQPRLATAMMDFFPIDASGLHLSAGLRLYRRMNFMRDAQKATNGLLFVPRTMANAGNSIGTKRYTPALTGGYSTKIVRGVTFDIEAGTLLGSSIAIPNKLGLEKTGSGGRDGMRPNPVVHFTFGYQF